MTAGQGDAHAQSPDRRGPTVLRAMVGNELRRLREDSDTSRAVAADSIRGSEAKMSRLEAGRTGFRRRDVEDLLTLYGVNDPMTRAGLVSLAEQANAPGWWHRYNDVMPTWLASFVGFEQDAAIIRCYEAQFVPGLLQTEAYARAVIALGQAVNDDEMQQRVALRIQRQRMLAVTEPPDYWAIVDEAVLRRSIGGKHIMREQLDHLLEVGKLPNVTVQVVPFDRGDAAASGGPFTLLRFAERDLSDIVYLEQLASATYLDKLSDVDIYLKIIDRLAVGAMTPERSAALIASARDSL
ncbi:MAG: helix-turn-helix domain-containing protein [Pseudonocardia sp.]|nr:helix-turn-helix domain-containing protein [Pseudonocardia sp.]